MSEEPAVGAYISSKRAAKMLGVKPSTLRKWRAKKKGPLGWVRMLQNVVVYPVANVIAYRNSHPHFLSEDDE